MGYVAAEVLMKKLAPLFVISLALLSACATGRSRHAAVDGRLGLETVVLYRNGVGYFERHGTLEGEVLSLRVRKDQVNDLLKSLTVVDEDGQAVSISMPLDPRSWANAALATLAPGNGSLAQVLDSMRGSEVRVHTAGFRTLHGRIVMVERIINEPDPDAAQGGRYAPPSQTSDTRDYKLTLLVGKRMEVVRLSKVRGVELADGDLAMQLHRSLDASAGEGMFEQVEVQVRLVGARSHRLNVSYVVEAPMWKPTYRVVLPPEGKGQALLQGWAVVDNVSGEDWEDVQMSLTSGAPIAFRYDLHTPRDVYRADLTESGVHKQARVAFGETSYGGEEDEESVEEEPAPEAAAMYDFEGDDMDGFGGPGGGRGAGSMSSKSSMSKAKKKGARKPASPAPSRSKADYGEFEKKAEEQNAPVDVDTLRRSTLASARSKKISGLTRMDLGQRVTVPDGTSTMVAVLNEQVDAEETYLYRPGGAGSGYEANPYHVVRFKNTTDYVLEPGPISVYSGGSFVGEGLSEAVGSSASVTIPFAVEPGIMVTSSKKYDGQQMRLTRIVRGVLEVESFSRTTTRWDVRGPKRDRAYRVLIRHTRQGSSYELAERPAGTEDLEGAYLIPIALEVGKREATLEVVEQTPSKTTLTIWDGRATSLLEDMLRLPDLDEKARAKVQPLVELRSEIGRIDTLIDGMRRQERELDTRAEQTRQNLRAIKKDPRAGQLRARLNKRLEEFTAEADKRGREIVDLNSKRLEKKIELEDMLQDLDLTAPAPQKGKAKSIGGARESTEPARKAAGG
jgi:hypothetical protein